MHEKVDEGSRDDDSATKVTQDLVQRRLSANAGILSLSDRAHEEDIPERL